MENKMVRVDSLKQGDEVMLRGGKKVYSVIKFYSGDNPFKKGCLSVKDECGRDKHFRRFPFTLIHLKK